MDPELENNIKRCRDIKAKAILGGGQTRIDRQHEQGKLTARERLERLLDPGSFEEVRLLVGHHIGTPGDGIISGQGTIDGRNVCIFAQDATVLGGSIGLQHGVKMYRTVERALELGVPFIGLYDSAGARGHRIDEPEDYMHDRSGGAVFYPHTQASGVVPQISGIMGSCAGIAVYAPALTDFIFMVEATSQMFVTGPRVVKAVISEDISAEELGGARIHSKISGVCDFRMKSDEECLHTIKKLLSYLPSNCNEAPPSAKVEDDPDRLDDSLAEIVPAKSTKGYDIRKVIRHLADNGDFLEVRAEFAGEMVTAFARLEGQTVGFVANQPMVNSGGLTCNGSRKQARFMRFCDAFNIPIILLVDTPAYVPGSGQERAGIIHHGAKVLYALCEATVPRIAVILRKMYGGGNLGMGVHPGLGTDFVFVWPIAQTGIMGAEQIVELFHGEEIKKAENPQELRKQLLSAYRERYGSPFQRASVARYGIDDVIEPRETRRRLIRVLRQLRGKRRSTYPKRHGNIPL